MQPMVRVRVPNLSETVIDRSRFADDEGISLVEMLVAILVLAVVMGAMVQSLATSFFSVQRQELHVHATALAAELVESAVSLPWGVIGLCKTAADQQYPTGKVDGEDVVVFPQTDDVCNAAGGPPIVPVDTYVRPLGTGVQYNVKTAVTWHDDVQDDDASGDPNTPQDLKRIRVTVSWFARGEPVSYTAETVRAPGGTQVGLLTRVEHDAGAGFTYLDDALTTTLSPVDLRLFAGEPQSAVSVSWQTTDDSNGDGVRDTVTRAMTNPSSDRVTWHFPIPPGGEDFIVNKLPNAEVLFTFTATAPNGDAAVVVDRGLFLIEKGTPGELEGHHVESISVVPTDRIVVKGGALCHPFAIDTHVRGALGSDPVTVSWSTGPSPSGMEATGSTVEGASFRASYGSGTVGFTTASSPVTYTITAERPADLETETRSGQITVVAWQEGDAPCS